MLEDEVEAVQTKTMKPCSKFFTRLPSSTAVVLVYVYRQHEPSPCIRKSIYFSIIRTQYCASFFSGQLLEVINKSFFTQHCDGIIRRGESTTARCNRSQTVVGCNKLNFLPVYTFQHASIFLQTRLIYSDRLRTSIPRETWRTDIKRQVN